MNLRTKLLTGLAVVATLAIAAQAQVPGVNSTLNAVFTLAYDQSTMKPTYSSTVAMIPATAPTDICTLSGSATTNVRVRRVMFSMVASAVTSEPVAIIKRSTVDTVGAGGLMVQVPYDSTNLLTGSTTNAATANSEFFTTSPTLGTMIGALADVHVTVGNLTTGPATPFIFEFGQRGSPVVLRGVAQQIAINLNGITYSTPLANCTFEWTEE